ncbi:MAG TPA: TldD/PmbA family protein [Anaerolineae bacterium]|nr:TldD/PmbA family protein [Anaerolineae bacterium]HPL28665.1 TldD/PmbA family protein [Anaerolineae bacterium]
MRDLITDALRGQRADYIDVRLEEAESTQVRFRGRELEELGRSRTLGGSVRALVNGGWGFASFNDVGRLRSYVEQAVHQARLVRRESLALAPVPAVQDVVQAGAARDVRHVSLDDKVALLQEYNELMWATAPLQTTSVRYGDLYRRTTFASSEGSYLEQEQLDLSALFVAVARKESEVEQAFLSTGSRGDLSILQGRHEEIAAVARRAVDLLSARRIKGGSYAVLADPKLAGVFVHEAFGHLSEADHVYENPRLREMMVLGRRFGGPQLSIVDGAAVPGHRGSYAYDAEGVPAQKTYLIREGVLVGRLHSRETAARMGEAPTGNGRAVSYRYPPIVRMTNTFIEPGQATFEQMLAGIDEGVYVKSSFGGQTSMEMFTFSAGEAYMIRGGKLAEPLRGVNLTGNVFQTLANIEAIGSDLEWSEGGGCGKGEQSPLPVGTGSPHLLIRDVVIGGE